MEVLDVVGPLNQFLCDLHGPTTSIARTMRRLVPFPEAVGSLPDADLLDLNVSIDADVHGPDPALGFVEATARYATEARGFEVRKFYLNELDRVGARVQEVLTSPCEATVTIGAILDDADRTQYDVVIGDRRGYRSVKVVVRYANFAYREVFDRFARWHNGNAPVTSVQKPTGLEISTFATGRSPNTLVLYSTDYACPQTPRSIRRAMVDTRISELGWTYREPREGIMFIKDGTFDAETHVMGDEQGSNVTFVGEFQLR